MFFSRKALLASAALVLGVISATAFRREAPPADPGEVHIASGSGFRGSDADAAAPLGQTPIAVEAARPLVSIAAPPIAEAVQPPQPAKVVSPLESASPPPALEDDYPTASLSGSGPADWPPASQILRDGDGQAQYVAHRIVDGDTLDLLAQRYLGDAGLAESIYTANRNVLPSPDALPIGAEIKIPLSPPAAEAAQPRN